MWERLERSGLKVYAQPRMVVLGLLGFSAGLPQVPIGGLLGAWLTEAGLSTVAIGLFSLIGLPFAYKFLWSPFLDRFVPPIGGRLRGSRRRGWLVIIQVGLMLGIALLGWQQPSQTVIFFLVALLVAFLTASQDIVIDAHRTDSLQESEMGAGAAVYVLGYRVAVNGAGSLGLFLADHWDWWQVYMVTALLMGVGLATSYGSEEPAQTTLAPASLTEAVVEPFRAFWQRYPVAAWANQLGQWGSRLARPQAVITLGFVMVYQLADRISGPLTTPFLLKLGFSKSDLSLRIWVIFFAATIGVLVGGWLVKQIGIWRSLFWLGLLQGVSNLSFMALALLGQNYPMMVVATIVENFCGGTSTAAFLAFLMSLCDRQFSATQYALLSSLFNQGGILAGSLSGFVAQLGWPAFWGLTAFGCLPALGLLLVLPHSLEPPSDEADPTESSVASDA